MNVIKGRPIVAGKGKGRALVTRSPMNFTAALTKPRNLIPSRRAEVQDRHHELYGTDLNGRVLVFPACIGSTYTGMVLLEIMYRKCAPAALIVQRADSLLVSGAVLADVWFGRGTPVVEYPGDDIFDKIKSGDGISVDGATGDIVIDG